MSKDLQGQLSCIAEIYKKDSYSVTYGDEVFQLQYIFIFVSPICDVSPSLAANSIFRFSAYSEVFLIASLRLSDHYSFGSLLFSDVNTLGIPLALKAILSYLGNDLRNRRGPTTDSRPGSDLGTTYLHHTTIPRITPPAFALEHGQSSPPARTA